MLPLKHKIMKLTRILNFTFFPALLLVILVGGCKKDQQDPPTALFSVENTEIFTGDTVVFNNSSSGATSYMWNFGDGGTSTEENPTHVYNEAGTFEVQLISMNADGSDTATRQVEVLQAFEVTIFEGTGIEGANISDPWSAVNSSFTTDTVYYIDYLSDFDVYYHEVFYYTEGAGFIFYSDTTFIQDTLELAFIFLLSPYQGATTKQIAIGSSMQKVVQQYGEPENLIEEEGLIGYWYDSRGVDFYSLDGSGMVDEIDVYDPADFASKKGVSLTSLTREILRKRYY